MIPREMAGSTFGRSLTFDADLVKSSLQADLARNMVATKSGCGGPAEQAETIWC